MLHFLEGAMGGNNQRIVCCQAQVAQSTIKPDIPGNYAGGCAEVWYSEHHDTYPPSPVQQLCKAA